MKTKRKDPRHLLGEDTMTFEQLDDGSLNVMVGTEHNGRVKGLLGALLSAMFPVAEELPPDPIMTTEVAIGELPSPPPAPEPPPRVEELPPLNQPAPPAAPVAPTSAAEWKALIADSPTPADLPQTPLDVVEPNEDVAAYQSRVLAPLGLTLASAAKIGILGVMLTSAGTSASDPSWQPLLEALA